jgi:ABC-type dipeptide/oligopeptide/nickel transport system permease subunit
MMTLIERAFLVPIGIIAYIIGAIVGTIKGYYSDGYDNHCE